MVADILYLLTGLALGGVLVWLLLRARITILNERVDNKEQQLTLLNDAQQKLSHAFQALSAEALRSNNRAFLELANASLEKYQEGARSDLERRQQAITELVKPVRESLQRVDARIQEMETSRAGAYASLTEQVRSLLDTQNQLRSETSKLVNALRTPGVRGRWGEIQLKRVVEMAGMLEHCDFYSQESVSTEDGRLRPDLLVRLPAAKTIIVDAKAPLDAFLQALDADGDDARKEKMRDHARQIRIHIATLSRKSYWEQFEPTPEFVVLFLPGENFFSAALEHDPGLIEAGVDKQIILATPTTLIALLRAVAYGWRQETLAQNAREISELGRELYKRLSDTGAHWIKLGKSLDNAVEAYNKAVGSLETRVMVTARKFKELETTAAFIEVEPLVPLDHSTRAIQAPELLTDTAAAPK